MLSGLQHWSTKGPAEKTHVSIMSSIQQCEEWRGFEGHRSVEHVPEFSWEHMWQCCSSKTSPNHMLHKWDWEIARNNYASSVVTVSWFKLAAKISWFLSSPTAFCGVIWRVAYATRDPPLWMNSRPVSEKRSVTCYRAWWMVPESASGVHHCGRRAFTVFCFQQVYSICLRLNFKHL